jgi:hypothetical protein
MLIYATHIHIHTCTLSVQYVLWLYYVLLSIIWSLRLHQLQTIGVFCMWATAYSFVAFLCWSGRNVFCLGDIIRPRYDNLFCHLHDHLHHAPRTSSAARLTSALSLLHSFTHLLGQTLDHHVTLSLLTVVILSLTHSLTHSLTQWRRQQPVSYTIRFSYWSKNIYSSKLHTVHSLTHSLTHSFTIYKESRQ